MGVKPLLVHEELNQPAAPVELGLQQFTAFPLQRIGNALVGRTQPQPEGPTTTRNSSLAISRSSASTEGLVAPG